MMFQRKNCWMKSFLMKCFQMKNCLLMKSCQMMNCLLMRLLRNKIQLELLYILIHTGTLSALFINTHLLITSSETNYQSACTWFSTCSCFDWAHGNWFIWINWLKCDHHTCSFFVNWNINRTILVGSDGSC